MDQILSTLTLVSYFPTNKVRSIKVYFLLKGFYSHLVWTQILSPLGFRMKVLKASEDAK